MTTSNSIHSSFVTFYLHFAVFSPIPPISILNHTGQHATVLDGEDQFIQDRISNTLPILCRRKKKTQRFYNCCDPLGVNVTAVLTAGKSRLLTAQQKRYRLPNISESVHEQTVLELLQDKLI